VAGVVISGGVACVRACAADVPDTPRHVSHLHSWVPITGRLGFNFSSAGSSANAPPLPPAAQQDGWWNVDHERVKVGARTVLPAVLRARACPAALCGVAD
jgi:hypothetical protein